MITISDYTASMTISRLKFSVGLSGGITFKLKARGSEEWTTTMPVPMADYYLADDAPISDESIYKYFLFTRRLITSLLN